MAEIWIIEGRSGSRKSATIRCLTGASRRGVHEVEFGRGQQAVRKKVYVYVRSPNEERPMRTPRQVHRDIQRTGADAALIPLQPRLRSQNNPAAQYFNYLANQGHQMMGVVLLGTAGAQGSIPANSALQYSHRRLSNVSSGNVQPNNATAAQVRRHWKWV